MSDLGFSGSASLLDMYTFGFSDREIGKSKSKRRKNDLARLSYLLKIHKCTDEFCEIEIAGSLRSLLIPVRFLIQSTVR